MSASSDQKLYEAIRREHEQLRDLLGNIRRELAVRCEVTEKCHELIKELQQHVKEHFHEEEDGGFFEQVVSQAPRMSVRAEALIDEHNDLSKSLDRCVTLAAQQESAWHAMQSEFHDFSKSLMHHESKENELLLDAYDQDIGSAD